MNKIQINVFFLATFLSGCSASVDPREGGLMGGISGIQSGAYQKGIKQRQNTVAALEKDSLVLDQESRRLDIELRNLKSKEKIELEKLKSVDSKLQQITNDVRNLSRQQNSKAKSLSSRKRTLDNINIEISRIQKSLENSKSNDSLFRLKLKKKLDNLIKENQILTRRERAISNKSHLR